MENFTPIDLLISFDTTQSMYPAISEVRKEIKQLAQTIFGRFQSIRMSLVAHGDYCDEKDKYLMKTTDFCDDIDVLHQFVTETKDTYGGDIPEAYEYVLNKIQTQKWRENSKKIVIMIGDAYPHEKNANPNKICWKEELQKLQDMRVNIYSVQCLFDNRTNTKQFTFFEQLAHQTNGKHLFLDQFKQIYEMIIIICIGAESEQQLIEYEQEHKIQNNGLKKAIRTMLNKPSQEPQDNSTTPVEICPRSRYQMFDVVEDCPINTFIKQQGVKFSQGIGYYEFKKPETVTNDKKIVLMDIVTGDLFQGAEATKMVASSIVKNKLTPKNCKDLMNKYRIFVQSKSSNRKLQKESQLLCEVVGPCDESAIIVVENDIK